MQKALQWNFRLQDINKDILSWAISKKEFEHCFLSISLRIYGLFMDTTEIRSRKTFFKFLATHFPSINENQRSHLRDCVAIYLLFNKRSLPYPEKANVARKFHPLKKIISKRDQRALPEYREEDVVNCWLEALALANKEKRVITGVFLEEIISNYLSGQEQSKIIKTSLKLEVNHHDQKQGSNMNIVDYKVIDPSFSEFHNQSPIKEYPFPTPYLLVKKRSLDNSSSEEEEMSTKRQNILNQTVSELFSDIQLFWVEPLDLNTQRETIS